MNADWMLPILMKDGYKLDHLRQYPDGTTLIYSNMTPRASRIAGDTEVMLFGMQYMLIEYLQRAFTKGFFSIDKDTMLRRYRRRVEAYCGGLPNYDHLADLHDIGFLPLQIKAVDEGTLVPLRVPMFTIRNTIYDFQWLTNALETMMSNAMWMPITSATTAFNYRMVFERFAVQTGASKDFIKWQGHDFSYRGMAGLEAAVTSGMAHLASFTGTDTIPAIDGYEFYYDADCEKELIGGSIPATEHSVMSMGGDDEATLTRLLTTVYPKGMVSVVADTWDFWKFAAQTLVKLKAVIMAREGRLVIRPDSGDPVKILCGDAQGKDYPEQAGLVRVLWNIFGGTTNTKGYRTLDPHIGCIYGDSITRERQLEILGRLESMGFASDNVVLGIGSYTYQHVTRDTYGLAMKATAGAILGKPMSIYKAPKTDDGTKNSARGLLFVGRNADGRIYLDEDVCREREADEVNGLLKTRFLDGDLIGKTTLAEIRARVDAQVEARL